MYANQCVFKTYISQYQKFKVYYPFSLSLKVLRYLHSFGKPLHCLITSLFCISALFHSSENTVWLNEQVQHCIQSSPVAFVLQSSLTQFAGSFKFVCLHVVCEWRLIVLQCHVIVLYAPLITYNAQETYHTASHLKIWHIVVWTLICNE